MGELLRCVRSWKMERTKQLHDEDDDESECDILHEDTRAYLCALSVEEAVEVATNCLVDGILTRRKRASAKAGQDDIMMQLERGLRKRVQAVVIRSNHCGQSKPRIE